ncbi:hypothetical protein yc1106_04143 [Curvularia clavata]|uniref:C3H1-type domain-containing protein n=1 Tax=Curvularia clavata TaxID=95742 RepID=A0A9Q9DSL0_CURCL|nr:hypothetical protein yc1106_04143 [Curvularia clavata]
MTFKFPPPPPPPPPKATSNEQTYASQRGGHNRGGSERGRGRGGNQNRGGGSYSAAGNTRGGHGQNRGRGDARGRGQRGGYQNNRGGRNHTADSNTGYTDSFSFNNTTTHEDNSSNTSEPYLQPAPSIHGQTGPQFSSSKHAGQKRKLTDRSGDSQPRKNGPQQSSKPPRAKAAVPPPVPSFGFSLPPLQPVTKTDNKKRKFALGLSEQVAQDEGSDEEDIDEEAAFSEKLKGGGFAFEHDGETISIQTGAEVAAWIKDRRKNFPTQKRIVEKQEEAARKRMAELDFLRRIKGKPQKEADPANSTQTQPSRGDDETEHDGMKQEAEKKRQEELATLRKKLHESMVKKQSAPVDLGVGYDSESESDEESSVLSESSVVSSSEASESESGFDADEDNEAPETTSSKIAPPPIKVPPAPAAVSRAETKTNKVCSNWRRNGRCPYLSKCKYQHPPREENIKHPGLYERMVEQELVKADQLALDAIKYLGQNGFLG